jgi:hypothetical protein
MTESESQDEMMPGDGVARENEDQTWTVYRISSHDRQEPMEGPFNDEATAVSRLRELFPVSQADRWVINRAGMATRLE